MRTATSVPSHPVAGFVAAVSRFIAERRASGQHRRVVRGLASLDDHMLRDIGLTRFDVAAALIEPAPADATLILAERARELHRQQRAAAESARARATLKQAIDARAFRGFAGRAA